MDDKADLVAAVRTHAVEHYTEGWDIVVEAYDDARIVEIIGKARTVKGAIAKMSEVVEVVTDYRRDIEATAF